jgi:transcriptional regulator with XRE-family HTH domain
VLAKALVRAAADLDLTQKRLAKMLGISPASASRVLKGRPIDPGTKEGELALLFLRLYRSLDALLGGGRDNMRAWLHAPNRDLGGTPVELVQSVTGLVRVVDYLDAMRGRV